MSDECSPVLSFRAGQIGNFRMNEREARNLWLRNKTHFSDQIVFFRDESPLNLSIFRLEESKRDSSEKNHLKVKAALDRRPSLI